MVQNDVSLRAGFIIMHLKIHFLQCINKSCVSFSQWSQHLYSPHTVSRRLECVVFSQSALLVRTRNWWDEVFYPTVSHAGWQKVSAWQTVLHTSSLLWSISVTSIILCCLSPGHLNLLITPNYSKALYSTSLENLQLKPKITWVHLGLF